MAAIPINNKGKKMENTPSRIAADILIAAIESKQIYVEGPEGAAAAFNVIHASVHAAADKDKSADMFNVFK